MRVPGLEIVTTPPHMHVHVDVAVKAGDVPTVTPVAPGAHGVVVTGTHGWGVKTPCAADVAEATWGLESVVHIPNGAMLTFGWWSMIDAIGIPSAWTRPVGRTVRLDGATPNEHVSMAPEATA